MSRSAAIPLAELLLMIASAKSAQELEQTVSDARTHYAGSMMEQIERAATERADSLLATLDGAGDGA